MTWLQPQLAQLAIALSVFSLITYLWLGATVLLMGNRRTLVTWVGSVGLLLGALFFLTHGALAGAGVPAGASPTDVWWRLAWVPAFAAPLFWAAIGLHYAGLTEAWRPLRLPALAFVGALGLLTVLLALASWRDIASYGDFIKLLDASFNLRGTTAPPPAATGTLPALGIAFVTYTAACAGLPWAALVARRLLPSSASVPVPARGEAALLWDANDAWSRARPALLVASFFMLVAGAVVAAIGVLVSITEHRATLSNVSTDLRLTVPVTQPGHVPVLLVLADLVVQLALAGLGLLIGWAVVRQGVLVERRLPQRGFLSHWRGMALVAAIFAGVVAAMAAVEPEALPSLLLLVTLVAGACALLTWQSYVAHERTLAQLRPFVSNLSLGHTGWLSTHAPDVERNIQVLFESLCRDVLGAARARLALSAGRLRRTFIYEAPLDARMDPDDAREWALPISDERGVVARLVLGARADGAGYTSADLEVARACGQRILDAVGEFAAAQAIAALARQRGLEAELSAALPRRVLHDDVLPRLHLAMLRLEKLRARLPAAVVPAATVATAPEAQPTPQEAQEVGEVVRELGRVHHDLAQLMRAAPLATQRRLEHGLSGGLRRALEGEFRGSFDDVRWEAPEPARAAADALPVIVADLVLGAALEAIRNAGRHARGDDLHRHLTLTVRLEALADAVAVTVADDGVGLRGEQGEALPQASNPRVSALPPEAALVPSASTSGTQSGLLTHAALIALVGGSLHVRSQPGQGTTVTIRVPLGAQSERA